jgi:hypothetical protein
MKERLMNLFGGKKEAKESTNDIWEKEMLDLYETKASESHVKYIADRLEKGLGPRYKPLKSEDAQWMKKNPGLYEKNSEVSKIDGPAINIAEVSFEQFPPSRHADSLGSYRTAIESVYRASKNRTHLDETFINATADTIHEQWGMRNGADVRKEVEKMLVESGHTTKEAASSLSVIEIEDLLTEKGVTDTELLNRANQIQTYARLTEENKELDRKYVREIVNAYKEKHPL